MSRKVRTPEELGKADKKAYSLYLDIKKMEYLAERASKAGGSVSVLVDEAITAYIDTIKFSDGKK